LIRKSFPSEFVLKKQLGFYPGGLTPLTADILEIGPGNGEFLRAQARAFPSKRFVAIELKTSRFRSLVAMVQRESLTNVLLIHADARVLPQYFPEGSFEKIYVLFPDPWPKPSHAFRRLLTAPFLQMLAGRLQEEGTLLCATDVQEYADWVDQNAGQTLLLRKTAEDQAPQTAFDKKWRSQGAKILYRSYCKKHKIHRSKP